MTVGERPPRPPAPTDRYTTRPKLMPDKTTRQERVRVCSCPPEIQTGKFWCKLCGDAIEPEANP
jgi:hypothetical protein